MDLKKTKGYQTFSVPNDGMGRTFIAMLRRNLNRNKYKLQIRNRGKKKHYDHDTKKEDATWFAVYVHEKAETTSFPYYMGVDTGTTNGDRTLYH